MQVVSGLPLRQGVVSNRCGYLIVVGNTSNFHFNTIPSSLGISIDGIEYDTNT